MYTLFGCGWNRCVVLILTAALGAQQILALGEITIVDSDEVEITNLHRQILHYESDIGKAKVFSAKETIER